MKIFVITPIFATTTTKEGITPVVHYITKEWVKLGHEVTIFHLPAKYPRFYYWISLPFQNKLTSSFGFSIPVSYPKEGKEFIDGETIIHYPLKKYKPHTSVSSHQQEKAINIIIQFCKQNGNPDIIIGHWDNPILDILPKLKILLNAPIGIVFHSNFFNLEKRYSKDVKKMMSSFDIIGFRSPTGKINFENKYGKIKNSMIVPSGVSNEFIANGSSVVRNFDKITNFTYVGSLIHRKHPLEILKAIFAIYGQTFFRMTYIGDGDEREKIQSFAKSKGIEKNVVFTGRIKREQIIEHLKDTDVFVMISGGEIFGLVYLEAMALGCLTVGSIGEGIDGIIKHGENGFLCCPGDKDNLTQIIDSIRKFSQEELIRISNNAKMTAKDYSDNCVARNYINDIRRILCVKHE